MASKRYGRFGRLLQDSELFEASRLEIPSVYDIDGVRPRGERLLPHNLVFAYRALNYPMDHARVYRMLQDRSLGPRCDVRTRNAAVRLCNVLATVYGIIIDYRELL